MFCRKCGCKKTSKRSAGIFHCKRCGMQPGQLHMDRSGSHEPSIEITAAQPPITDYVFAPRQVRMLAGSASTPNMTGTI